MTERSKTIALWVIAALLGLHLLVYATEKRFYYFDREAGVLRVDRWTGNIHRFERDKGWVNVSE